MAISILGGKARGFTLQVPPENITRPTSVMLKRRLFDWRQDWSDFSFADLCAGSGAMGLEALSRGAQNVWLNEPNRVATRVLQKNVERWHEKIKLDVGQTLQVTSFDFTALVTRLLALPEQSGLVLFFDPPYENHRMYQDFWTAVQGFAGEVWVESDELKGVRLNDQRQHMSEIIKEVSQGDHWLVVGRARARQS